MVLFEPQPRGIAEPLPRPSGNSPAPTMKRPGDHALSPGRTNVQQVSRFTSPRTPRSSEFPARASSSSVFFPSAGFPTQTQQASTWKRSQSRFTEELASPGFAVPVCHWYVWASATFPFICQLDASICLCEGIFCTVCW